MNTLPSTRSPLAAFPSWLRWSPLPVVVALLAACGGDPPTACESIPQQTLFVRETSLIQPCFTDPEGEKLTLSAKAADKQIATVIVLGGAIRIQALYPGNTTVTVTAEDPGGQTASIDIDVLVPNRPPTTRGRLSSIRMLVEGINKRLIDEYFSDPDGQQLTFTASSANESVATAEIVDSIRLLVLGVTEGTTTVTVTATDPGGLSVDRQIEVEVLEPVEIFADEFTSGTDGWVPNLSFATGARWSANGFDDDGLGVVRWRNIRAWYFGSINKTNINVTEWDWRSLVGVTTDRIWAGPRAFNSGNPLVYWFGAGYAEGEYWYDEGNYRFVTCCFWQSEGQWSGDSDVIKEYGEYNELFMTLRNGELVAGASSGGTDVTLIVIDIAGRGWATQMATAQMSTRDPAGGSGLEAVMDWTEMWGLPPAEDGPPPADWEGGPVDAEVSELVNFAVPTVEIRKQ